MLENLLCREIPDPPTGIPQLDDSVPVANGPKSNVRQRLEQHRRDPACSSCHTLLDSAGFALEHFDAIGRYRTIYEDASPLDDTATWYDGTTVQGLFELTDRIGEDDSFLQCMTRKTLTYALGRPLRPEDEPEIDRIFASWRTDSTFRRLVR